MAHVQIWYGNIFKGMGHSYSRPLHGKGDQWNDFGILALTTVATYLVDGPTSEYFGDQGRCSKSRSWLCLRIWESLKQLCNYRSGIFHRVHLKEWEIKKNGGPTPIVGVFCRIITTNLEICHRSCPAGPWVEKQRILSIRYGAVIKIFIPFLQDMPSWQWPMHMPLQNSLKVYG